MSCFPGVMSVGYFYKIIKILKNLSETPGIVAHSYIILLER